MILFDTERFFSWDGRYAATTFEFWIRGSFTGKTSEHCIIGFTDKEYYDAYGNYNPYSIDTYDPYFDVDGIFMSGNVMYIRNQGQHICSATLTTIDYPTLVDVFYSAEQVTIMFNGEVVANGVLPDLKKSIDLDGTNTAKWGFSERKYAVLSNKNFDYDFEVNNIAMYPYSVSGVVAKKRFVRGQGVQEVDTLNNTLGAESFNCSYDAGAQSPSMIYSGDFQWDFGVLSNLAIIDRKLSLSKLPHPEVSGKIDFDSYNSSSPEDAKISGDSLVRFNTVSEYVTDPYAIYYSGDADITVTIPNYPRSKITVKNSKWVLSPYGEQDVVISDADKPLNFFDPYYSNYSNSAYNFMADLPGSQISLSGGYVKFFGICSRDNFKNDSHTTTDPQCSYLWHRKPVLESAPFVRQKSMDIGSVGYFYDNVNLGFFADAETETLNSLQINYTYPAKPQTSQADAKRFDNHISWGFSNRYVNMYVAFTPYEEYTVPEFVRSANGDQGLFKNGILQPDLYKKSTTSTHTNIYPVVDGTTINMTNIPHTSTMHIYVDFSSPGQDLIPLKLDYMKITPNKTSGSLTRDGHEVSYPSDGLLRIAPQTNEYLYKGKESGWLNLSQNDTIDFDAYSDTKFVSFFARKNYSSSGTKYISFSGDNFTETISFEDVGTTTWSLDDNAFSSYIIYINGVLKTSQTPMRMNTWYHIQLVKDFGRITGISLGPDVIFDNIALFEQNDIAGEYLYKTYAGINYKVSDSDSQISLNDGTSRLYNNVKRERFDLTL